MRTLYKFLILACFATVLYWEPAVAGSMCCDGGFIRGEDKEP